MSDDSECIEIMFPHNLLPCFRFYRNFISERNFLYIFFPLLFFIIRMYVSGRPIDYVKFIKRIIIFAI